MPLLIIWELIPCGRDLQLLIEEGLPSTLIGTHETLYANEAVEFDK